MHNRLRGYKCNKQINLNARTELIEFKFRNSIQDRAHNTNKKNLYFIIQSKTISPYRKIQKVNVILSFHYSTSAILNSFHKQTIH